MTTSTQLRQLLDASVSDAEPRRDLSTSTLAQARTQRSRRLAIAGSSLGVAAVAAITLGFVVVAEPFDADSAPRPNDVASEGPVPDADGDGKVELSLDVPRGDDPQIGWLEGTTLHLEGGAEVELPHPYDDVVAYEGGYLAEDAAEGTIDRIIDGEVNSMFPGSGLLASPNGIFVTWFETAYFEGTPVGPGELKIRFADGEERGYSESTVEIPAGLRATPVAFRDQGVLYQTDDESTCGRKVWFGEGGNSYEIEGATAIGGYSAATDQAAVQTKVTDTGSCWSTYAFPGGEFAGALTEQTCDYSLGEYSADGKYLIGWPAYADGWGPGEVAILDADTFKPVMEFDSGEDYGVMDAAWDGDANSLIATVYLEGTWQLLRLGPDGSMESVADPVEADDVSNPFRFAQVGCCPTIVD